MAKRKRQKGSSKPRTSNEDPKSVFGRELASLRLSHSLSRRKFLFRLQEPIDRILPMVSARDSGIERDIGIEVMLQKIDLALNKMHHTQEEINNLTVETRKILEQLEVV